MRLPGVLTRHFAGREAAFRAAGLPCRRGEAQGITKFCLGDEHDRRNGRDRRCDGGVNILLRLEGLTLFVGMVTLYWAWDGSWLVFALLFFVPDLSFLAYLSDAELGAMVYNAAHSYMAPVALLTLGFGSRLAAHTVHRLDLARPYRHRPGARLWPEIFGRVRLRPSRPDRPAEGYLMAARCPNLAARPG